MEFGLRRHIAQAFRVPSDMLKLWPGVDSAMRRIAACQSGPIVTLTPSELTSNLAGTLACDAVVPIVRGVGRRAAIDAMLAADLPSRSTAFVDSPSTLLGSVFGAAEAVRLARACRLLVIDERFAEYSGLTLLPLVNEFDNIVILRTFETWAGLCQAPCAWAAGAVRALADAGLEGSSPSVAAMAAAQATLDDLGSVEATLKIVRDERSRLMRQLRKFSFLEPLPSWGPFVTARVVIFRREMLVSDLRARGIRVHAPAHQGLEQFIRIGIGTRREMEQLRTALLDIAPGIAA